MFFLSISFDTLEYMLVQWMGKNVQALKYFSNIRIVRKLLIVSSDFWCAFL